MLRILRSAAWISCFTGLVVVGVLWPRSYVWREAVYQYRGKHYWDFVSWGGRLSAQVKNSPWMAVGANQPVHLHRRESKARFFNVLRFSGQWDKQVVSVAVPHWAPVVVFVAGAFFAKPKPRRRISLLDLWVAVTIGTVALAALGAIVRNLVVE